MFSLSAENDAAQCGQPLFSFGLRSGKRRRKKTKVPLRRLQFSENYRAIGREPVMRMSTSLLALCCQSGPDATWETPISARSRSNGSRSLMEGTWQ